MGEVKSPREAVRSVGEKLTHGEPGASRRTTSQKGRRKETPQGRRRRSSRWRQGRRAERSRDDQEAHRHTLQMSQRIRGTTVSLPTASVNSNQAKPQKLGLSLFRVRSADSNIYMENK